MLERATAFEPSVVEGRFMIQSLKSNRPWIVIVEPDNDASLLVIVTAYEVSESLSDPCRSRYRKGKPFLLYLHLSHQTEKRARGRFRQPTVCSWSITGRMGTRSESKSLRLQQCHWIAGIGSSASSGRRP